MLGSKDSRTKWSTLWRTRQVNLTIVMWIWKLCLNDIIDFVVDISAYQVKIWTRHVKKGLEGNYMWIWACVSLVVFCQHKHFYSISHDGGTILANKRILEANNLVNNNSKSQKPRVAHCQIFYFPWYLKLHKTSQSILFWEDAIFMWYMLQMVSG